VTALVLVSLAAPVILGGIRSVARVTEWMAPVMAFFYVLLALVVVALNLPEIPGVVADIVRGAFGLDEALAGTAGGMLASLLNGVKRGLFSNEAGMGSAPNAAATATVAHPAQQGFIQSLGVFVDTIIVCSATAFMILLAGPAVYTPGVTGDDRGAVLTQTAVAESLGTWTTIPMTALIFVFAFSSVLGNFTYAEVNTDFIRPGRATNLGIRLLVVAAVAVGALLELSTVWALADVAMGLMATVNLVALFLLGRWALGALRDYERQAAAGAEPTFVGVGNPDLPGDLPTEVWLEGERRPVGERLQP
jgi:AGCS family alanine or glycine:cation symporter